MQTALVYLYLAFWAAGTTAFLARRGRWVALPIAAGVLGAGLGSAVDHVRASTMYALIIAVCLSGWNVFWHFAAALSRSSEWEDERLDTEA